MSGGFHVHGPHDHAVEHAAQGGATQAQATTVLQIAIALSAIALITRRKWLANGVYGVSVIGFILGVLAFLHI